MIKNEKIKIKSLKMWEYLLIVIFILVLREYINGVNKLSLMDMFGVFLGVALLMYLALFFVSYNIYFYENDIVIHKPSTFVKYAINMEDIDSISFKSVRSGLLFIIRTNGKKRKIYVDSQSRKKIYELEKFLTEKHIFFSAPSVWHKHTDT